MKNLNEYQKAVLADLEKEQQLYAEGKLQLISEAEFKKQTATDIAKLKQKHAKKWANEEVLLAHAV